MHAGMVEEARLEELDSGLAPVSDGWFVVNARDSAWVTNEAFGARCVFEGSERVLHGRPDLTPHTFDQLGFTLAVIPPGRPNCMYHAESDQEDFLVLAGECLLLVDGEERELRAWDFVHCPGGTQHVFVATGKSPCVIFMAGARDPDGTIVYPRSELALRHSAGVEVGTTKPSEAYAPFPHWQRGRPEGWDDLPWA